ncbi:unnamed protein product [Parnassius apollo]|uniref:(apollo) hypothetical protein n=1 Tax=Parnassius apollo TaxID=110799 RepID=A0A8S3XT74_PARAO|nr:unnamed protein product [Parnassius apollo]
MFYNNRRGYNNKKGNFNNRILALQNVRPVRTAENVEHPADERENTGASISVIKEEQIPKSSEIFYNNLIINGIGGKIEASSYVILDIYSSKYDKFTSKFYSFKNLPIAVDGILGLDFMTRYKAKIDLENSLLTLKIDSKHCILPIFDKPDYSNSLVLAPRSESIHYVYLNKEVEEDCFVCAREIEKDVFLAGTIVQPKNKRVPIKILNTRDEEIRLNNFTLDVEPLREYNIFKFGQCKSSSNRAKSLLPLLELNHLNNEEKESIESICSKYSDIFFLPDASDLAVGAVLCNKNRKPIAYASRPLNKAEKNYPVIEKELTAIVWAVKYFRPYLFGRTFTIMTDHKP